MWKEKEDATEKAKKEEKEKRKDKKGKRNDCATRYTQSG
jgi:hypothetical protein